MEAVSYSLLLKEYHYIFVKKDNAMSNLQASYSKILSLLHEIESNDKVLNHIRMPKASDKEWIALTLAAECANWVAPNDRYCAAQKNALLIHYYGYKIHVVCSPQAVF